MFALDNLIAVVIVGNRLFRVVPTAIILYGFYQSANFYKMLKVKISIKVVGQSCSRFGSCLSHIHCKLMLHYYYKCNYPSMQRMGQLNNKCDYILLIIPLYWWLLVTILRYDHQLEISIPSFVVPWDVNEIAVHRNIQKYISMANYIQHTTKTKWI